MKETERRGVRRLVPVCGDLQILHERVGRPRKRGTILGMRKAEHTGRATMCLDKKLGEI